MATVGMDTLVAAASAGRTLLLLFDFVGTLSPTVSNCPWKKPSLAFFHLADRWKSRGFPWSATAASCAGRLLPQPANPEQARLPTEMRHILVDLAVAGCQLGVITSRSLADIQQRIDIPGVWLAGSGGLELCIRGERIGDHSLLTGHMTIAAHSRAVAPAIDRLPGAWLEPKPLGLTIHHRDAPPDTVLAVRRLAADLQAGATDVRVTVCTFGVEIAPFPEVHKGTAVSALIAAVGDESPGLLYAGNDHNDAAAMVEVARHGGWVIGVGNDILPSHTHVSSPSELCELLVTLGLALGRTMGERRTTGPI